MTASIIVTHWVTEILPGSDRGRTCERGNRNFITSSSSSAAAAAARIRRVSGELDS